VKPVAPELSPVPGDPRVLGLAALARGTLQGEPSRRDAASFARVAEKISEKRRQRRRITRVAGALGVAIAAFVALVVTRTSALTYRVVNGAVVEGQRVVAGAGTEVRFSDGSALLLTAGAQTRIAELGAHGGRVRLDEGTAKVTIAKRPGASWTLAAGPYSVRVTGTAFSLHWSEREQNFEIAMQSGSVVVTGPLINSGITLRAGQRLESLVGAGRLVLDDGESPAAKGAVSPLNPGPTALPAPSAAVAPPAPSVAVSSPATPSVADEIGSALRPALLDWRKRAAQGQFSDVIEAAERRGLEATLGSASLEDLAALADSARYARRPALAKRVLLAERSRFPRSAAARDAAFLLGRIAEDEGAGASEWYDRYLSESPAGAYASQALGRKMMLAYQRGSAKSAAALAATYLDKYPSGAYAGTAKKIGAEARSSAE